MSSDLVHCRIADHSEDDAILSIHRRAFGQDEGPIMVDLLREMLADTTGSPALSLVAERQGALVGHVLFTRAAVEPEGQASAKILAPLAVDPDHQSRGIGGQLVHEALRHLTRDGCDLIFVLGYPAYYSRFGFMPAGEAGFQAPYPIAAKNADAWMVKELKSGAIQTHAGTVRCLRALDHAKYWQE